jgi:SAM-dependent methyltransferase
MTAFAGSIPAAPSGSPPIAVTNQRSMKQTIATPGPESPLTNMNTTPDPPTRLYSDLATWFHLLTPPEDYAEEAEFYRRVIVSACAKPPVTLLELGSGGGNNAAFLKARFKMTLVDLSPQMIAASESINPECEHRVGDMRSVRLNRSFDAVFIQDAISYMTTPAELRLAIETAFAHCQPGGAALFVPDQVRETFRPSTSHGGKDTGTRAMRYLEWAWDPDPGDTTYLVDFAFLLRDRNGEVRVERDRHQLGLFGRDEWLRLIGEAGFEAKAIPFEHSAVAPGTEVFLGVRRGQS